jgi:co-chaperonin GroES (HSP10)
MDLRPVGKRIIVHVPEKEAKPGGLILNTTSQIDPFPAKVIAVGDKCETPVSVGDTVLLTPYAGMNFCEDKTLFILEESVVLGVVKA